MLAFANNTNSAAIDFASIEQLTLPDSDTWLFFLSANNIFFTAPVDDLWYSAHQQLSPLQNTGTDAGQIPAYQADYPANVIGCTTRYQYCNPNLPIETGCVAPFSPTRKTTTEHVRSIFKTERQQDLFENFAQILQLAPSMSIGTVVDSLGVGALKSRNTLGRGVQAPLPANQWQLEVQSWVSTVLAGQQRAFVEHSTGTLGMSEVYLQRPSTAGNRTFCNSQVRVNF